MNFDLKTSNFKAEVQIETDIKAPTVIFVSREFWYADGFTFSVNDKKGQAISSADYSVDLKTQNRIVILITNPIHNAQVVTFIVVPSATSQTFSE
jgi:hypothetical protein